MKILVPFLILLAACGTSDPLTIGESSQGLPGPRGEQGPPGAEGPQGPPGVSAPGADDPSGSRLKALYFNGTDGSRVPMVFIFDSQRGEKCLPVNAADGVLRCLPYSQALTGLMHYGDPGCSLLTALYPLSLACSGSPATISRLEAPACGLAVTHIHKTGPIHMGGVYLKNGASCVAAQKVAGYEYYDVGAEIDPTSFVEMTEGQ